MGGFRRLDVVGVEVGKRTWLQLRNSVNEVEGKTEWSDEMQTYGKQKSVLCNLYLYTPAYFYVCECFKVYFNLFPSIGVCDRLPPLKL